MASIIISLSSSQHSIVHRNDFNASPIINNGEALKVHFCPTDVDSDKSPFADRIGLKERQVGLYVWRRLFVSVSRLAKQTEHILLVGLNSRLVEGIHPQHISAHTAGKLKEID